MHVCLPAVAWYLPAGHREPVSVFQFPTKPASVTDESLVNFTCMYPVVDVQLRLDEILLLLSVASSELDLCPLLSVASSELDLCTMSHCPTTSSCR
jgi:hypothetical protein